ncbi:hypothetical protein EV33_03122 [Listeria monocytogenes]|nr:hypothetical protein EV33_03122 [Listeria monocytogenes]
MNNKTIWLLLIIVLLIVIVVLVSNLRQLFVETEIN